MQQIQTLNQVHKNQCTGLLGEYCGTIFYRTFFLLSPIDKAWSQVFI
jgi:hypothetical protein